MECGTTCSRKSTLDFLMFAIKNKFRGLKKKKKRKNEEFVVVLAFF
jgi:hypothetical protein